MFVYIAATVTNGSVELGQNGSSPWIGENVHPDDGYWLSRYLRFQQNCSAAHGPPGPGGGKPGCNMDELCVTYSGCKTSIDVYSRSLSFTSLPHLRFACRYNHSSFIDLIISAMIGLRATAGALLTINPL
eukprot:SAG31_NODE_18036_length_649_cov_0.716364_1_plen_129_part_10